MTQIVPGGASHDEFPGNDVVPRPAGVPDRFENPGLPEHRPRLADIDRKAARRAELQVSLFFVLSSAGTVLTIVGYFVFKLDGASATELEASNFLIGFGLFLTLFGIGVGAVHWAKTLMPDHEMIEERHAVESTPQTKADAAEIIADGIDESGIRRRPLILASLGGALAIAPLPAIVLLKDTGPNPGDSLRTTLWANGVRLVQDPTRNPVRASDIVLGSIFHVLPEGLTVESEYDYLEEKAKAAAIVIRLEVSEVAEEARPGSYAGLVAYSKICTHMGCSVALYEQTTQHLLCPCHQSTFDLRQNCKVIFGPAKRALPQLPIGVDDEGYLLATGGLAGTPGPSFWELG